MIKNLIKFFFFLLLLLLLLAGYLSYFGVETEKFNKLIIDEIEKKNSKLKIKLNSVNILLNLKDFSVNLKTTEPKITIDKKKIELNEIKTNFSIKSLFKKDYFIDDVKILTNEIKVKDIIAISRLYKNTPELYILQTIIKDGYLVADIELNFNKQGKIKNDYQIKGFLKNGKIRLLNKKFIQNLDFIFQIRKNQYLLSDLKLNFNKLKFFSKSIQVENQNEHIDVSGNFESYKSNIEPELLTLLLKKKFKDLDNINLSSKNKFSFKISKKFKISELNLKSDIVLYHAKYKFASNTLKQYLPKYNNLIEIKKHKINLNYNKGKLNIQGDGNFIIDDKPETINYSITNQDNNYSFESTIEINHTPIVVDLLNYKKKDNIDSLLKIEGFVNNKKEILFKNIFFKEKNNKFSLFDLRLNKNFKINSVKKIELDYLNNNQIENKIILKQMNRNYVLLGKIFDITSLVNQILTSNKDTNLSNFLNNINTKIDIKINKTYIDKKIFVENLTAEVVFKKNELNRLVLNSKFPDNKELILKIKKKKNNEKITSLISENAEPFVKKYRFIKGFEKGILNFNSIKKNNVSNSKLNVHDFKLKELPILTKLLALSSLQGIADLLTGEGIRFDEFEMNYTNEGNLMTIDEIYAIGPTISILMDGYIEKNKLVSLSGTLVPATTINKAVGSIPVIGNILVGEKTGEGIFGVSFKIKGPPKNLETKVNPIKTLTPRFITRTLEKIKKN
jgi:hypothetical protein